MTSISLTESIANIRKLAFSTVNGDRTWTPDLLIILTDTTSFNASPELISEVLYRYTISNK